MKAQVARFYGWTDDYINGLSYEVFMDYLIAIKPIKSMELMSSFGVSSFPNYKVEYQRKVLRETKADIRLSIKKEANTKSANDIVNDLARKLRNASQ